MKDTPTRVFGLMCVLVGVWTAVYWLYEPGDPPVTFDTPSRDTDTDSPSGASGPMAELSPPITPAPERRPAPRVVPEQPKPQPAAQDQPRTRVVPPEYWEYTVQPGDKSMENIARKLLGEGRLWVKIAEANPLLDARKLIAGRTKLRIPKDLTNIQGKEVAVHQTPTPAPAAQQPTPKPVEPAAPQTPAKPAHQDYVVKSGDTLSSISKAFYGKSALWRKIYEANQGVIDDPDNVKPGTTIRIPPEE